MNATKISFSFGLKSLTGLILTSLTLTPAWAALSPEAETLSVSKKLKPISDEQWQSIAGIRVSESYLIEKGDNLWEISKRLFGDGNYWPKVWAINNGSITNPHLVIPGKAVVFSPGSGSSLPSVAIGNETESTPNNLAQFESGIRVDLPTGSRSSEWKKLPRQAWEQINVTLPPEVDPQGFDRRNRVTFSKSSGFELGAYVFNDELDVISEIKNSGSPANGLTLADEIYLERDEDAPLEVGKEYTVTQKPTVLSGDGNTGYVYENRGTIRVIGEREDLYIAQIVSARIDLRRGDLIVGLFERVGDPNPIPGPEPLEAELFVDPVYSTSTTAEHKLVFINLGSEDGIQPGMVFRAYDDRDSSNGEFISDSNIVGIADFQVVQTSEEFSAAVVRTSTKTVEKGVRVVLLTEVSDLIQKFGETEKTAPPQETLEPEEDLESEVPSSEEEDLDGFEEDDGSLTPDEEKELQQLEEFQEEGVEGEEFSDEFGEESLDEGAIPPEEGVPAESTESLDATESMDVPETTEEVPSIEEDTGSEEFFE